jgi:putative aldouronate transport system permease protein
MALADARPAAARTAPRAVGRTPLERIEYALIVSTLLLMVVLTLQPMLHLVAVSLSDPGRVAGMSGLAVLPDGLSLDVWRLLASHPNVQRGLLNSVLITGVGTAINVAATALMAWALAQRALPGRRVIYVGVLLTIVFEPGIIPDYFVMRRLGLLDSYWSVILYKAVNAWYLIILVRFFEEVPRELLEAAELDGANPFQTFVRVVLPLARPALATITLFYLVFHWNEFFRAMIYLSDQTKWPLQVVLRQFVIEGDKLSMVGVQNMNEYLGASRINIRALNAGMIVLTVLPILAIYPLILRFFTKGTMAGAIKG